MPELMPWEEAKQKELTPWEEASVPIPIGLDEPQLNLTKTTEAPQGAF